MAEDHELLRPLRCGEASRGGRCGSVEQRCFSHLDLPLLTGTDRQMSWASTIRTTRLAALAHPNSDADCNACLRVTEAKWWIDCRDLTDVDLMAAATKASDLQNVTAATPSITASLGRHDHLADAVATTNLAKTVSLIARTLTGYPGPPPLLEIQTRAKRALERQKLD